MKKFFYMAVAAIAALSSCSGDDAILNEGGQNEAGVTTFTATIEDEGATRTTYNATTHKAEWVEGEAISVDGNNYTAASTGASTTFTGSGATGTTHHAYFPASLYNSGTPTLPATQTYTAGEFNMPMYAESTTTEFTFKNLCAVLAVKVTSADITTLKSIRVKADKALSGAFTVSESKAVLSDPSDNTKTVELVSSSALTLDATGTTFYIAIPAQDYAYLNIYLSADGTNYKEAMATKKVSGLGTIARSAMYNIDYVNNAVQLWATGPYFATENVLGKKSQTGGNAAWGDNWELPSQSQWEELADSDDNVTRGWSTTSPYGFTYTGKGDYSAVSLFLPAENGDADGGDAYYWSGSAGGAYGIYMDLDCSDMGSSFDFYCSSNATVPSSPCLVRLVLKN